MKKTYAKNLYFFIQKIRGERVQEYLFELEKSQWFSKEQLEEIQLSRLKKIVNYSYHNIPFYKELFSRNKISVNDFQTLNDFKKFPVISKSMLKERKSELISKAYEGRSSNVATSGSTGDPLSVIRSRESTGYNRAACYRARRWFGIDIGEPEARLWGVPVSIRSRTREKIKDLFMNRIKAKSYNLTDSDYTKFINQIKAFKPSYLFGYASLVHDFAKYVINNGIDVSSLKIKGCITTSETLHDYQRKTIEKAFSCPAINEYGSTEAGIIAYQCPQGGMHIPIEVVHIDIISDSKLGNGLGRVIVTDLHNYAMPVIRYDIGDIAIITDKKCECGRGLPLLQHVAGRESSVITLPSGKRIHTILFYYIMCDIESHGGGIKQFQVIQKAANSFTMKLVRDNHFDEDQFQAIKNNIKDVVGPGVVFNYEFVDYISRTDGGKLRDFISLVGS